MNPSDLTKVRGPSDLTKEEETTLQNLINRFKLFLYDAVKENDDIKEDIKKDIVFVLDRFITTDIYAFKSILKVILTNKEEHLKRYGLTANNFGNDRKRKFEKYLDLFKGIYNL